MTLPSPPLISGNDPLVFNINRWDLLQCRLWVITQNRFLVGLMLVFSVGVPLLYAPAAIGNARGPLFLVTFYAIQIGFMFAFMVGLQIVVHTAMLFAGKNQGVLGRQQIIIRDDALVVRSEVSESIHHWTGFQKMRQVGGFIFLYVGGNIVYYVPLRAFPSRDAAQNFKSEIKHRASQK